MKIQGSVPRIGTRARCSAAAGPAIQGMRSPPSIGYITPKSRDKQAALSRAARAAN